MRSYSRDKNVLLEMSATKDVVLNLSATKHAVLNVCSLFCGLDFVCALSFLRSSNKKKCGLNPALPKNMRS